AVLCWVGSNLPDETQLVFKTPASPGLARTSEQLTLVPDSISEMMLRKRLFDQWIGIGPSQLEPECTVSVSGSRPLVTAWVIVAARSSHRAAMSCFCLLISASILAVSRSRKLTMFSCSVGSG